MKARIMNGSTIIDTMGLKIPGSVSLPDSIILFCPKCGEKCAKKGKCLISFIKIPAKNNKGFKVKLSVDCRVCGCSGQAPATDL